MEWKTLQEAILASYYIVSSDKKWEGDDILPVNYPSSKKERKKEEKTGLHSLLISQPTINPQATSRLGYILLPYDSIIDALASCI